MNKNHLGGHYADKSTEQLHLDRLIDAYKSTYTDGHPCNPRLIRKALFKFSLELFENGTDPEEVSIELNELRKLFEFFDYLEYGEHI